MTVIGLTGGIASGKTTIAKEFRKMGAVIIDADKISNRLLMNKAISRRILKAFPSALGCAGGIDKRLLAEAVFCDKRKLEKLCRILHPAVLKGINKDIRRFKNRVAIIDAPLLIESGLDKDMDYVVVVSAARAAQLKRGIKRGFKEVELKKRIKFQMPLKEKIKRADFVLDNNRGLEDSRKQVKKIWRKLNERKH